MSPLTNRSFPRAILHFDGDSFFSSVEQALNYKLRGKPVVTGGERGAATSLSYEAKKLGLHRGMTMREIKIRCPEVIIVPSDYTSYGIYARRMYSIVRSFTPTVEEYSIDECFADITGLQDQLGMSYERIALRIKEELETSLGITFGVGLAPTKTLAKAASKLHKPAGFVSIPAREIHTYLEHIPIHNVWGLGGASGTHLEKLGVITALDFIQKDDAWLAMHKFGKAYRDVWLELRGNYIKTLNTVVDESMGSIMSTRTFNPPSSERSFVFSQLSKNVEMACAKLRRHHMKAKAISFYLKTQEFTYHGVSLDLSVPVSSPMEILEVIENQFDEVFAEGVLYRATGITLRSLVATHATMPDLFGEVISIEKRSKVFETVDKLNQRYGRNTLFLGSSAAAFAHIEGKQHTKRISKLADHSNFHLTLDQKKKTLSLPYLGTVK